MFEKLLKEIESHERIVIHRHTNPDGDALGSQIGLKHLLLANFPFKQVRVVGDAAGRYAFMDDSVMDDVPDRFYEGALAIILDTSAKGLISDERYTLAARTARVDHHIFCETIAQTEVVDSSFESCAGLIAAFAEECKLRVTPLAAKSLYTGMVTDSGRFLYDATTSRTLRLAAFLMEQPFDITEIYNNLYATDLSQAQLRARFMLKIQRTEAGVAYLYNTKAEVAETGADTFTISRGMVSVMSNLKGVSIWANFTETDQGVLCELRSSRSNINPIAVKHGGGGHAKASGATLKNREEAMQMLRELDALVMEEKA